MPNAPKVGNGQIVDEVHGATGMYHRDAVGLAKVGRNLSQELVKRHPCRGREVQFVVYLLFDALRYVNGQFYSLLVLCNV